MNKKLPPIVNQNTMLQFNVLTEIDALLRPAGIGFWLRGGWALDFLLGYISRAHSDIDLVAWKHDAVQIRGLLEDAGFLLVRETAVQYDFSRLGQDISVVFIVQSGQKVGVENIPEWIWLPDALTFTPQQLDGLLCNVISPAQLLEEKEGYEQGTGIPLRAKDLQSIKVLCRYLKKRLI